MLSNCLEDEDRFRGYIDEAIEKGDVKAFKAYTNESEKTKAARMKAARDEGEEAEEYAKELGVHDKMFGKGGKSNGEDALKALILKKNAVQGASLMDRLEAKYGGGSQKSTKGKRGKKRNSEELDEGEPSEEAFQAAAKRLKKGKENENSGSRKSKRTKA
jgi:DnaJ family protein C protein 9